MYILRTRAFPTDGTGGIDKVLSKGGWNPGMRALGIQPWIHNENIHNKNTSQAMVQNMAKGRHQTQSREGMQEETALKDRHGRGVLSVLWSFVWKVPLECSAQDRLGQRRKRIKRVDKMPESTRSLPNILINTHAPDCFGDPGVRQTLISSDLLQDFRVTQMLKPLWRKTWLWLIGEADTKWIMYDGMQMVIW